MSNNVMIYNSTVPSSPPQNVMVKSVIPASLMVSWEPPPSIDHNGPITGYVIQYTRVGSSDMMDVNFNSEIRQYNILGLVAYVNYSVMVAARNSNGTGDYSDAMVVRSGENGELSIQLLAIYFYREFLAVELIILMIQL